MNEDCADLENELREHEEKSHSLFKEAESLHGKALKLPYAKRGEAMNDAIAKQKEAIEEIHITADIKNKINNRQCEEAQNKTPN